MPRTQPNEEPMQPINWSEVQQWAKQLPTFLEHVVHPHVAVTTAPDCVVRHRDLEAPTRDGTILLRIPLLPSATRFEVGEILGIELHRHWFFPHQPISGQFPATYERPLRPVAITLQIGGKDGSTLLCSLRPE